ncbi:hypothetical protein BU16DRAFT_539439 [Lophium mytilinum]|uniref:Uncharacterized protein n=1 Tax=Lophium mytilinum TaxID=390894 RepID=A0A6A6QWU7_9PEZI|nr:hypothetical protein BU16DRAFT_539439 [Lophium mytilinum]
MTSSTYNLSADLTLMILMELESPTDLYSFVRTTKLFYQIFQNHKASVLSAVLHNAIHPAIMEDFLLANRAYSICSLSARREYIADLPGHFRRRLRNKEYRSRRLQRVKGYLEEDELLENFRDLDTLYSLCNLWTLVNGFIDDFAARAQAKLLAYCLRGPVAPGKSDPLVEQISSTPLSRLERARLFRAFCRFEEYRRLYGGPDHVCKRLDSWPLGEKLVQKDFLARYQPWELLEMFSIHNYLIKRMTEVVHEEEDTLFTMFAENVERESDDTKKFTSLENLELYDLEMFDDRYFQDCQIKFMVELGLPFLNHIATADFGRRLVAMKSFTNDTCTPTLDEVLKRALNTHWAMDKAPDQGRYEKVFKARLRRESPGYHFFSPSSPTRYPLLQEAGIIFWDQTRLDIAPSGLLDVFNPYVPPWKPFRNGDIYVYVDRSSPPPQPKPERRPTIGERLQSRVRSETLRQLGELESYHYVDEIITFLEDLEY